MHLSDFRLKQTSRIIIYILVQFIFLHITIQSPISSITSEVKTCRNHLCQVDVSYSFEYSVEYF